MDEGIKAYKEGDDLVAIEKLSPLAHMGGKAAQLFVGEIYAFGSVGVPKNDEKAIYWFRRCGSFGAVQVEEGTDPAAPYELYVAKAYASGSSRVKIDLVESNKWLRLAAAGGNKEAAEILAKSKP